MNVSFDLQTAALVKRRAEKRRAAAPVPERSSGTDTAQLEIVALKREQAALSRARESALRELDGAPDRIVADAPRFLVEAYSRHPAVKITDSPGRQLTVAEFLRHVRRMVVGFVVSRLLNPDGGVTDELDDVTTYYLLPRNDFGLEPAAGGASILYALSCNLSDSDLAGRLDVLARGGKRRCQQRDGDDSDATVVGGGEVRLKAWSRRRGKSLGEPDANGTPPAAIDSLHRLMQLWKAGDRRQVDRFRTHPECRTRVG